MSGDTDEWMLSTADVCMLAGLSYRQIDYMVRAGLLTPAQDAHGSGSVRRWAPAQVRVARLASILRDLGAPDDVLRPALAEAADLADEAWGYRVLVTPDGHITTMLGTEGVGYLVDLTMCRDTLEPHRVPIAA